MTLLFFFFFASVVSQDYSWMSPDRAVQSAFESFQSGSRQPNRHEGSTPIRSAQKTTGTQEQQAFLKPLTWRFPDVVEEDGPGFPPEFEVKVPVPADNVAIHCGPSTVRVEAKKDLLGIGKPIQPADITLGDCPVAGEDPAAEVLLFESELHGCGSQLITTDESLVYMFTLHYNPSPIGGHPIVRTRDATIPLECHYPKNHGISSEGVLPTWIPHIDAKDSVGSLYMSLRLKTDDGQFERPSSQYFLGDMLRIEALVQQFYHVPLRMFVDSCVATLGPNPDTVPRYAFLGNKGCLIDSKLTNSGSRFLPRTEDDKLEFQVEAFKFQDDSLGLLYITCNLRVTTVVVPISTTTKACSYSNSDDPHSPFPLPPQPSNYATALNRNESIYYGGMAVTHPDAEALEVETRGQSTSKTWHRVRAQRLTSSDFKSIVSRVADFETLATRMQRPKRTVQTQAMMRGIELEPIAAIQYEEVTGHSVSTCGFAINPNAPHLGASPDRKVADDSGQLQGLLEINPGQYLGGKNETKDAIWDDDRADLLLLLNGAF
ncbi:zona pellucida sperm-binding protein 3-like [Lampris incognitus]|uniref:zona pellucida sperm-binding protein 3-like n=1 Tax=Lampris incognitus TaxID=2546036 RepID=UPI0024B60F41|nr:zona pellucida sperm-binding protein 3-like [Lampris incognitus]